MKRTIQVCLGDEACLVGELRYDRQGQRESAAFAYDASWLAAADRFAIDPTLPLVSGFQFHKRTGDGSLFHGVIADTEPDGWGRKVIVRDHAKRRESARTAGVASPPPVLGELDFLLAVDDVSRLGALRFRDEQGVCQASSGEGQRRAPPLLELRHLLSASRAVEMSAETEADLAYLRGRGTSLGGLRPKCSILDDDGHLAIGKFPSVADQRAVTKAEVLALRLAGMAGITVAEARLIDSDGLPVALVRRFDRNADGKRVAYASAATMLGVDRGDTGQHTYTEIVDAIRIHGNEAQRDIEELWRRIAFSIRINNVDDHLHNHGFLYAGNSRWRLSPAFDINPFPDRVRELKTWISEETGPTATIDALRSVAPYFRITAKRATAILAEVDAAVGRWRQVGTDLGMTTEELQPFGEAFESLTS
jgi:serine/threonine-protein kinase HipA